MQRPLKKWRWPKAVMYSLDIEFSGKISRAAWRGLALGHLEVDECNIFQVWIISVISAVGRIARAK